MLAPLTATAEAAAPLAPAATAAATATATIEEIYSIPAVYQEMENLHILFWLVKDIAWCMIWRLLGLLMVVPTLGMALLIAWRTRAYVAELAHNLAIVCWITANSY